MFCQITGYAERGIEYINIKAHINPHMSMMNNLISIREPTYEDENNFLAVMHRSHTLHAPWVQSLQTPQDYRDYLQRSQQDNQKCYLIRDIGHLS